MRYFLLLLGSLAGSVWAQNPISVAVSLHPHFDLVRQLTGDAATVTRILPTGASPHTFDPTPRDVARIADTDLVVLNGGVDEWLLELVAASGTDAEVIELLEVLDFEPITGAVDEHEATAAAHAEAEGEHAHESINPHLWTDPVLMAQAVPILVDALSRADPENAATYAANGNRLSQSLETLNTELASLLEPVRSAPFVPFHDAWPYFVRRYGLNQVAVVEPAPGREPSPSYLAEVLGQIRASGAKAIFNDVQLPPRPAEIVAESAGVALYTLDPVGGGVGEDETYEDFMRANAATLVEALSQ